MTAVQGHTVPDGDFVFQDCRLLAGARVQDAVVLHVRAIADANVEHVAADDAAEPDGRLLAHVHIADYLRTFSDECRWVNLRVNAAKWSNHDWRRLWQPARRKRKKLNGRPSAALQSRASKLATSPQIGHHNGR